MWGGNGGTQGGQGRQRKLGGDMEGDAAGATVFDTGRHQGPRCEPLGLNRELLG